MTTEELGWVVRLENTKGVVQGTGVLIADNLMLTAHHVAVISTVGYTGSGESAFDLIGLLEHSIDLDYAIMRIQWHGGKRPSESRIIERVLIENTLAYGKEGTASSVSSFGFPADKAFQPTRATGSAKYYWDCGIFAQYMFFNIGLTNGTSGSPVFADDTHDLVAIVTNGTRIKDDPDHDGNDLEDARAWNYGPALFEIYKDSDVLKARYPDGLARPDGRGIDADTCCVAPGPVRMRRSLACDGR